MFIPKQSALVILIKVLEVESLVHGVTSECLLWYLVLEILYICWTIFRSVF